jgi:tetratricopeptide (TPR) repeat protein
MTMRRVVLIAAALALGTVSAPRAQDRYSEILFQYLGNDPDAAVARLLKLPQGEVEAGLQAFATTRAADVLQPAAAMHMEAALRQRLTRTYASFTYHFDVSTAIVQFGEPGREKPDSKRKFAPRNARPVSPEFRLVWYREAIMALHALGKLGVAEEYLAHARARYPRDPEILLLAGITQEMHASPRTTDDNRRERQAALERAERIYREALPLAPDREELRLRLGRVLSERNNRVEARTALTPLAHSSNTRIAYLASLFLGGLEDAEHKEAAALEWYGAAIGRYPLGQSAQLAASELRQRAGDRARAGLDVPPAIGESNDKDPWWSYVFGEFWRIDDVLDELRRQRRAS